MFFRSSRGRVSDWRRGTRANKELEKAAREGSLDIDLGQVLYLFYIVFIRILTIINHEYCYHMGYDGCHWTILQGCGGYFSFKQ